MPETIAGIGAFFAGSGAAAGATVATADAAFGEVAGGISLTAGEAAAGGASAAGVAAAAGAGAAGGGLLQSAETAGASAAAAAAVGKLLAPKAPQVPGAVPMPDALAQQRARQESITEQLARRGRASTILTDDSSQKLGG